MKYRTESFTILVPRKFGHIKVLLSLLYNLDKYTEGSELEESARLLSTWKNLREGQEVILSTTDLAIFVIEEHLRGRDWPCDVT